MAQDLSEPWGVCPSCRSLVHLLPVEDDSYSPDLAVLDPELPETVAWTLAEHIAFGRECPGSGANPKEIVDPRERE